MNRHIFQTILAAAALFVSCRGEEHLMPGAADEGKIPIRMEIDTWIPTRASTFNGIADYFYGGADGKGGGHFTVHAFDTQDGEPYISGDHVWYFTPDGAEAGEWRFYEDGTNSFKEVYWPGWYIDLDFLAYMPYSGSARRKSVSVAGYTPGEGLYVDCSMQEEITALQDPEGQETVIAFAARKNKQDVYVPLNFIHPFTAVELKVSNAHRDTHIRWIRLNNVHTKGRCCLSQTLGRDSRIDWMPAGEATSVTIPVGLSVPSDINLGAVFGGPYLFMPQSLENVSLTVCYEWHKAGEGAMDDTLEGDEDTDPYNGIYTVSHPLGSQKPWESGKKYIYSLYLGDNEHEILFKVLVEDWIFVDHENRFDVE